MGTQSCNEGGYLVRVQIKKLSDSQYLATSKNLPGLVAEGRTVEEVSDIARDVARENIKLRCESGDHLPRSLKPIQSNSEV